MIKLTNIKLNLIKDKPFKNEVILKVDCSFIKKEKNLIKSIMIKDGNSIDEIVQIILGKVNLGDKSQNYYLKSIDSDDFFYGNTLVKNYEYFSKKNFTNILLIIYDLFEEISIFDKENVKVKKEQIVIVKNKEKVDSTETEIKKIKKEIIINKTERKLAEEKIKNKTMIYNLLTREEDIKINKEIIIKIDCSYIKNEKNLIKSLMVKSGTTITDIINMVLEKVKMNQHENTKFFLKNVDSEDYFYGDLLFNYFSIVNQKFESNQNIFLIIYKFEINSPTTDEKKKFSKIKEFKLPENFKEKIEIEKTKSEIVYDDKIFDSKLKTKKAPKSRKQSVLENPSSIFEVKTEDIKLDPKLKTKKAPVSRKLSTISDNHGIFNEKEKDNIENTKNDSENIENPRIDTEIIENPKIDTEMNEKESKMERNEETKDNVNTVDIVYVDENGNEITKEESENIVYVDENGDPVDKFGNSLGNIEDELSSAKESIDESSNIDIVYVDENGNEITKEEYEDITYIDEDGNPVDKDGNLLK
jgi:hypothetical protein